LPGIGQRHIHTFDSTPSFAPLDPGVLRVFKDTSPNAGGMSYFSPSFGAPSNIPQQSADRNSVELQHTVSLTLAIRQSSDSDALFILTAF
jgi:hypothetical protein